MAVFSRVVRTHQVVSGSVHLGAPVDGAVKLLVADELLLDGCRIVSPGSCFNQTLKHQTDTETCTLIISTQKHTLTHNSSSETHIFRSDS